MFCGRCLEPLKCIWGYVYHDIINSIKQIIFAYLSSKNIEKLISKTKKRMVFSTYIESGLLLFDN